MRDFSITRAAAVTPSDTEDMPNPGIGLYIGTGGNIKITTTEGFTVILTNLAPGVWHPISVRRVFDTDTAAGVKAGGIFVGW